MDQKILFEKVVAEVEEVAEFVKELGEVKVMELLWNDYEEELKIRREGGDYLPFTSDDYIADRDNSIGWDWISE